MGPWILFRVYKGIEGVPFSKAPYQAPCSYPEILGGSWYLIGSSKCTSNCTYSPIRAPNLRDL